MAIVRDCGDFEVKVGFSIAFNFTPPITREQMKSVGDAYAKLGDEIKAKHEKMELELLDFVCDKLGYDEAKVKQLVDSRTAEEKDAIVREQQGRAHKAARRSGR